ncbi:glycosyl transferase, family 2 [Isorropodon fossajaponicum endosymbiont JTNG4]|uniref:glycosyltransferase family 2 protein n=1 Tax=Isorropodon fossajaponicum symbiont TaxID=883811 RepID=UPI0019158785|nr:glycosyltransferase family 2 protein [Isorropodon fossajaponicum symbiont]BBB24033.1 glycosyl transferase, family 2 [Isorropodon fossajaponicum endosymbiont JTNG4]
MKSDLKTKKPSLNKLLITVVTVVFNGVKFLEETIKSVINQTYDNIEYIIIDGGSTDGTIDIIKKYEDKIAYWVSESDKGIYDAMNKGVDAATGNWINFMNAEDKFYSNTTIEKIFNTKQYTTKIIYGDVIIDYGNFLKVKKAKNFNKLWQGMVCSHQSTFIESKYHKENKFILKYSIAGDFNFFYNVFKQNDKTTYIQNIIAIISLDGVSDINRLTAIRQNHRIINNHKFNLKYNLYYLYLYVEQFIKKIIKLFLPKQIIDRIKKIKQ